ncbi:ALP1-like protein [Tanacetum coccineum]
MMETSIAFSHPHIQWHIKGKFVDVILVRMHSFCWKLLRHKTYGYDMLSFGVSGLKIDVNVIHHSPLFNDLKEEKAPEVPFLANGVTYPWGYYLVDAIYLEWLPLVMSISNISEDDHNRLRYKRMHEATRKGVKQAFGALIGNALY